MLAAMTPAANKDSHNKTYFYKYAKKCFIHTHTLLNDAQMKLCRDWKKITTHHKGKKHHFG